MQPITFRRALALGLSFLGLGTAQMANATIVSATITGGTGLGSVSVQELTLADTPFTVGDNNFDENIFYMFNEQQNVMLLSDLAASKGGAITLAAGMVISSHFFAFDPASPTSIQATMEFDSEVLGVARSDDQLIASNFLGLAGVTYLNPAGSGLEQVQDFFTFPNGTPNSNKVTLQASTPGDVFRVFTLGRAATSPVPEPSTWAMMLLGFGVVGAGLRRRRKPDAALA